MSKLKVSGNASGTGVITLEAPNTNTDRAITLPDAAGELINIAPSTSGNVLTSDGTDWTSAAAAGGGKVLQVVQGVFTGTASTTAVDNSFVDTGITVNITPSSSSSKILIMAYIGKIGCSVADRTTNFKLVRGSTDISIGDASGSRIRCSFSVFTSSNAANEGTSSAMTYLDSPITTSSTTYKIQWAGHNGDTHYLNRAGSSSDNGDAPKSRTASMITVMEIGA